jgi:hypothetical protein
MTYLPGMTKRDWKHIEGEQHRRDCPCHEEWEPTDEDRERIDEIGPTAFREWVEATDTTGLFQSWLSPTPTNPCQELRWFMRLENARAPFQWLFSCRCAELDQDAAEDAALAKGGQ